MVEKLDLEFLDFVDKNWDEIETVFKSHTKESLHKYLISKDSDTFIKLLPSYITNTITVSLITLDNMVSDHVETIVELYIIKPINVVIKYIFLIDGDTKIAIDDNVYNFTYCDRQCVKFYSGDQPFSGGVDKLNSLFLRLGFSDSSLTHKEFYKFLHKLSVYFYDKEIIDNIKYIFV
jgi:hypothetical protein